MQLAHLDQVFFNRLPPCVVVLFASRDVLLYSFDPRIQLVNGVVFPYLTPDLSFVVCQLDVEHVRWLREYCWHIG